MPIRIPAACDASTAWDRKLPYQPPHSSTFARERSPPWARPPNLAQRCRRRIPKSRNARVPRSR